MDHSSKKILLEMRVIDRFIPFFLDVVLFQDRNYRYIGKMIWGGIVLFLIILLFPSCTKDPLPTPCTCIYEDGTKQPCETVSPPIPFTPPIDMICY